ncbi:MAG: TRAP transporter small permease [Rhodocyclaceae bacterium]|nr:TRAP transporter small permease [Rhodocyclaceae bacterium]
MSAATHSSAAGRPAESGGRSAWRVFAQAVKGFNVLTGYLSAVLVVVTSLIVCYGVFMRYFMNSPIDWGLELSIFLLIIATFMSAAYTQLQRGHVNIEVLEHILSPRANFWRYLMGDALSLVFCGFLAFNAWEFFLEAFEDGRITESTWGPKLWVPYLFMAIGSTALALQLVVQIVDALVGWKGRPHATGPEWRE